MGKTLEEKVSEIHEVVLRLEGKIPDDLRERFTVVEDASHREPCDSLVSHFAAHNSETERIVHERRSFWRKITIAVAAALITGAAGSLIIILLKMAHEWGAF